MKKVLLSTLSLLAVSAAISQTTISEFNIDFGSQFTLSSIDFDEELITFASGPNQVWDFSDLPSSEYTETIEILDPENAPFSESFPAASAAFSTQEDDFFEFYQINQNGYALLGESNTYDYDLYLEDGLTYAAMPMTFGNTVPETLLFEDFEYGERAFLSSEVVGYGSIELPNSISYDNVLLLHVQLRLELFDADENEPPVEELSEDRYFWMHASLPYPIFSYTEVHYEGEPTFAFGGFVNNGFVGVNETTTSALSVYPNPAQDVLNIALDGNSPSSAVLRDLQGNLVQQWDNLRGSARLDISLYPAGYYFLAVQDKMGASLVQKIIIQ